METFIRSWKNIAPVELCDDTINAFETVLQDPTKKDAIYLAKSLKE